MSHCQSIRRLVCQYPSYSVRSPDLRIAIHIQTKNNGRKRGSFVTGLSVLFTFVIHALLQCVSASWWCTAHVNLLSIRYLIGINFRHQFAYKKLLLCQSSLRRKSRINVFLSEKHFTCNNVHIVQRSRVLSPIYLIYIHARTLNGNNCQFANSGANKLICHARPSSFKWHTKNTLNKQAIK